MRLARACFLACVVPIVTGSNPILSTTFYQYHLPCIASVRSLILYISSKQMNKKIFTQLLIKKMKEKREMYNQHISIFIIQILTKCINIVIKIIMYLHLHLAKRPTTLIQVYQYLYF